MNKSVFALLQKIGQSLMMPVAVLPAAGLLVALGRLTQNFSEGEAGAITQPLVHALGQIMFSGGLAIFEQLPLVFAIGVAIGFTGGAGVAGLASAVGYFTMVNVIKVVGEVRELPMSINTGVFGGIIIGLLSAQLYKNFHQTKLHPVFGFFSGKRLVPIVTAAAALGMGLLLGFMWPPIQDQINHFGASVMSSDFGPAFYAAGKRLLIPVGLHHVYYPPFLYEFGEFTLTTGKIIKGESARYFAGDPTAGRFMASEFPLMLFALPAATFAMYLRAPLAKRKAVAGVMLSAALTSIITGITEPIEFSFIFVAPILFVFHVVAAFVGGFLTGLFDIHLGYTFSASIIDYGLGFFNAKNSIYLFTVVGPAMAAAYFTTFYYVIGKMDLKTPGRETDLEEMETAVEGTDRSREILIALGGSSNIGHLDACITRLRLALKDITKVNKNRLKSLGATGMMDAGGGNLQVIFGVESDHIKEEIKSIIAGEKVAAPKVSAASGITHGTTMIQNPIAGKVMALSEVPDKTFSDKLVGDGVAIDPSEGIVYAPMDAKIAQLFSTNHAIGLRSESGVEILIHVGIDTVKMKGDGFRAFVKKGDTVKMGSKLIEFDISKIRSQAKSTISPVIVTNMADVKDLEILGKNMAKPLSDLIKIEM